MNAQHVRARVASFKSKSSTLIILLGLAFKNPFFILLTPFLSFFDLLYIGSYTIPSLKCAKDHLYN